MTRTVTYNLRVLQKDGKAYRNIAKNVADCAALRFSSRPSKIALVSDAIVWPETVEEAIRLLEDGVAYTIRFTSDPYDIPQGRQGVLALINRDKFKVNMGFAPTDTGYVFSMKGLYTAIMRECRAHGQDRSTMLIDPEWLPALKARFGWQD
jgi:hypothetical protein